MNAQTFHPNLNQIAISVVDLRLTERWFREGLGFLPAGGSAAMMQGPLAAKVQGIPGIASTCWWLVGRNGWFQLELFQFKNPLAQLMSPERKPNDIGYTRIGVHVADFDKALADLAALGTHPLSAPLGPRGRRRACVRNPDGVYVEVMEDDPLPGGAGNERACVAAVRSVTMSTPDLRQSVAFLTAINGHGPEDIALHTPEHEALWGLPGAKCQRAVFRSGDVLVEVVQYEDPVGKPWPQGYRITDQGILNIAYGARNKPDHMQVYARAAAFGARPNCKPVHLPGAGVVYVNDALGFSVEILWARRGRADKSWGFVPLPMHKRPQPDNQRVAGSVRIAASPATVWKALNEHDAMGQWIGFSEVRRTRKGFTAPDGHGAERYMRGQPGTVVEQVTGVEPGRSIRYRVIEGSPFVFHQGLIELKAVGQETEVAWSIRFRSRIPLAGALLRPLMQGMLNKMLQRGLKPYAERAGKA